MHIFGQYFIPNMYEEKGGESCLCLHPLSSSNHGERRLLLAQDLAYECQTPAADQTTLLFAVIGRQLAFPSTHYSSNQGRVLRRHRPLSAPPLARFLSVFDSRRRHSMQHRMERVGHRGEPYRQKHYRSCLTRSSNILALGAS